MNRDQAANLRSLLDVPDSLTCDTAALEDYHHDATPFYEVPPAILLAESADDVATAVRFCSETQIPITARGAGTGLSGGCVVTPGGLLISVEKLREFEIDPEHKVAICGPGVITQELVDAANQFDLTYPPDPASLKESSLGGNVAENAGGLRCKRFGVTKDYVLGMEAVLADGSILKTGVLNDQRGFSLGDLLIGSEGTLAIITRLALRLIDKPGRGETILIAFDNPKAGAQTVTDINSAGIIPSVMEFLDGDAAACSNEYETADEFDAVAAILLIETSDIDSANQAKQIKTICNRNACSYLRSETDPDRSEALWNVRRNLSNAVKSVAELRVSEDVAVPNSKFPELVDFVALMNQQSKLRINSFGHAGDGNLHVNFLVESDSEAARTEIDRWIDVLMHRTIEMNGTLTGEHGIGLAKRQYLELEFDRPTLALMRTVKAVFDPTGRLNPDKLFPPLE